MPHLTSLPLKMIFTTYKSDAHPRGDAAPSMVAVARERTADGRLRFTVGTAERLPATDGHYDLVVSTTSFDHWADQFSLLLWPTLLAGRRGKARTRGRATRLVTAAGFRSPRWRRLHAVIIQAVTAAR
jgi:hypothetical protein